MQNNKNIFLATILSAIILISWSWFYEKPRMEKREEQLRIEAEKTKSEEKNLHAAALNQEKIAKDSEVVAPSKSRQEVVSAQKDKRLKISSENLHGSISLVGARFDDLTLAKYFTNLKDKKEVVLLSPSQSQERYFADFGWVSSDSSLQLPTPETLWQASSSELTPKNPVILTWKSAQNVVFEIKISLDENYMFSVAQSLKNNSGKEISAAIYGRINRALPLVNKSTYILHEGMIGNFGGVIHEVNYEKISEEKRQEFSNDKSGWLGITDKYWLSAIIPDKNLQYNASFDHEMADKNNKFNAEFVGQNSKIASGEKLEFNHHFFAGAKKVELLDQYAKDYEAKLFDRTIDFGWFYFLTKPFFFAISYFSKLFGNFGLAILMMTVIVKLALFPMANKSYLAIGKVKKLQPKIDALREKYKNDKAAISREMMELYKREKVNPAAGCLPILIQIPIFFSLYKVLYVTLDMRHAPFYGWIKDLSAPDPTSLFNLFGLLPFEVSPAFTIGIWPILMGITMIIQQKLSPAASDPVQVKVMKWMPFILTFVLATFPAGLVIYWTWSNALSILQQYLITKRFDKNQDAVGKVSKL